MRRILRPGIKCLGCILMLVVYACRQSSDTDPNTALFSEYLATHFDRDIPEQPHLYLLVPANGCKGGMANALMQIDQQQYPTDPTIITADPQMVSTYLRRQPWEVLKDVSGDLDLLNLPVTNVSLIATKGGRIIRILSGKECADGPGEIIALLKKG